LRLRRDAVVGGEAGVAPYSMALRTRRRWSAVQQISAAKVVSGRCAMRAMRLSYGMETWRAGIWGNQLGGTDAMRNRPAVPPASGANVRLIRTLPPAGPAVRPTTERGIRPCEACRERITIMTGAGLLRHVQHAGRLRELAEASCPRRADHSHSRGYSPASDRPWPGRRVSDDRLAQLKHFLQICSAARWSGPMHASGRALGPAPARLAGSSWPG
jgi:hypothetical protein